MKNEKNDKENKTVKPVSAAETGKAEKPADKAAAEAKSAGCGEDENSCGSGCCCCGG